MTGLYTSLKNDAGVGGVYTLTGGRIYEVQAPQDDQLPVLVFGLAGDRRIVTFTSDTLDGEVQVDIYASTDAGMATLRTIAARVVTLWHRAALTVTGWNRVTLLSVGDGLTSIEDDANRIILRFRVFAS